MYGGSRIGGRFVSTINRAASSLRMEREATDVGLKRSFRAMSSSSAASSKRPLVIVLAGPTGVGKSDVALALCQSWSCAGQLVSADSVQTYRGVRIGANKPSPEEMALVRHHLVDVVPADGTYTAADWHRDAVKAVDAIVAHDNHHPQLPVVVGGTMMYLQWLVHGRPDATKPTPEAVARAAHFVDRHQALGDDNQGWDEAVQRISEFGPVFRARVEKLPGKDWYRLRRTLEVAFTHEMDDNDNDNKNNAAFTGQRDGALADRGYDVRCFFLCPDDRMEHTKLVDQRCERMLLSGLLRETTDLRLRGDLPSDGQPARAIGYRQTLEYLEARRDRTIDVDDTDAKATAFHNYLQDFATATRQYAKKQMSWFRRDGKFLFVPVSLTNHRKNKNDTQENNTGKQTTGTTDNENNNSNKLTKEERVQEVLEIVTRLCRLSREEYEAELSNEEGISMKTIRTNQEQAKGMKFYLNKQYYLTKGSKELDDVMKEADECTERMILAAATAAADNQ